MDATYGTTKTKTKSSPFGLITAVLVKMQKFVILLKIFKPLITLGTMLLSICAYSSMMGWWLAAGFVIMICIHELGHVIALKMKGMPASAPIFIPFLGAAIFAPNLEDKPEEEAFVGYGGPLVGGLAALGLFLFCIKDAHPSHLLLAISTMATFVNLFNMIPIRPLDGGRITQIVGNWFKYIGLSIILFFLITLKQPSLLLIVVLVLNDIPLQEKFKFILSILSAIGMTTLMCLGYGHQPLFANIVDVILISFFCALSWFSIKKEEKEITKIVQNLTPEEISEILQSARSKPVILLQTRIKWFAYYVVLAGSLLWLFIVQSNYAHTLLHK